MKSVPKPLILALLIVLAALGWWYFGRAAPETAWLGYVEGETVYVAAPVSGRLQSRSVDRGVSVALGAPLFSLDPETSDASVSQAEAQVVANSAQAADLSDAKQRQAEVDVFRANEAGAQAQVFKSQRDFERMSALQGRGFASRSQLDSARAARDGAQANLSQARAQIRSAALTAGRSGQILAAQAGIAGAQAALRSQRKVRSEIAPVSPAKGVIEQTFFNQGEWVPANTPVVAVLPDDKRKLRFYVPEDRIAMLNVGSTISYTCDGCAGSPLRARISYIAPRAEYTPPVIYSERARAKLVFLVEALLPVSNRPLPLGLPVQVQPQ